MKIPTAKKVGGTTDEVPTLEKKAFLARASWWYVVLIQGDDFDVLESL